jgi:hypothetical protein
MAIEKRHSQSTWIMRLKRNFAGLGALVGLAILVLPPTGILFLYWSGVGLVYPAVVGGICLGCGLFYLPTRDDVFVLPLLIGILTAATIALICFSGACVGSVIRW